MSRGKRTKHIKAKYFFVADRVADRDLVVKHVPTTEMWADMNAKPKQGLAFKTDRSKMMNCELELNGDSRIKEKMAIAEETKLSSDDPPVPKRSVPSNMTPKISWEHAQECVGRTKQLGSGSGWSRVTSTLRGASKRLLT
eukprot:CCRYP_016920-RB/>CCRYP_016920-RB protein AED:0.72 eAED:0.42 QI:0/-1/0/1/-1/0/1/0/139